ncbi:MAG: hypothetical protein ACTSUK_05830 [Promethearchaeota archaeon]
MKENIQSQKKPNKTLILIGLFVVILILELSTFFQLKNLSTTIKQNPISVENLPIPKPKISIENQIKYTQYISPDGKLKIKYPQDWATFNQQQIKRLLPIPNEYQKKYQLKHIFMAGGLAFDDVAELLITEGSFDPEINFDNLIDLMKKINQDLGTEINISNKSCEDNVCTFDTEISRTGRSTIYSKEKILFLKNKEKQKVFFICVSFSEPNSKTSLNIANTILNSVNLVE